MWIIISSILFSFLVQLQLEEKEGRKNIGEKEERKERRNEGRWEKGKLTKYAIGKPRQRFIPGKIKSRARKKD